MNEIVVFEDFFQCGLRLSLHPFIYDLLAYFNLTLNQLCLNALRHAIACFVLWRRLGFRRLYVNEFRGIYMKKRWPGNNGSFYFQATRNMKFILDCIEIDKHWRSSWFIASGNWDPKPSTIPPKPAKVVLTLRRS